jgi:membrane protein CcdC involved in cytochrome C biogenesis
VPSVGGDSQKSRQEPLAETESIIMFENSWLKSKDKELRKVAILCIVLAPFMIAAALLAFAAFPFHYVARWAFWPAAFAEVLVSKLITQKVLLAKSNRKIRETETELLRVKARLENSD